MRLPIFLALFLVFAFACTPLQTAPDASEPQLDAGDPLPDAGPFDAGLDPPALEWRRGSDAPPARSNHLAFFSRTAHVTLVFSGNHVSRPIHDAWSWNGTSWQPHVLGSTEFPERKNAGLAVDTDTGQAFVFGGTWSGYPPGGGQHVVRTLSDLQLWDGAKWTELSVSGGPAARGGAATTWDAARRQMVLFGGSDNLTPFDDTWTFDGATWTRHMTAKHPSARVNGRMAYDPQRQRVVLFGGQAIGAAGAAVNLADTWEWDGMAWHDVTASSPQPPGRGHHALEWDAVRRRVMLLGGARHFSPLPAGSTLADQWEWDGTTWTEVQPAGARPLARCATSLSFDEDRRVMVLYGGFRDVDLAELWEWDGTTWAERTTLPLPRTDFAFAQQPNPGGDALLFGGYVTGGAVYLGDTHRFSAGAWHELRGTAPPNRSTASLTMHGDDGLLLGGRSANALLADCWRLRKGAVDWEPVSGTLPPPRRAAAMAYDPNRKLTVLFGGRGAAGTLGDTWIFDGATWAPASPEVSAPARFGAKLVFDPRRAKLVLLGGVSPQQELLNDAWEFDGASWHAIDGLTAAPTPRSSSAATFDAYGRLIVLGGRAGQVVLGDLAINDGSGWSEVPSGPSPRFDGALLDLGAGALRTVFGSTSDFSTFWEDSGEAWELAPKR